MKMNRDSWDQERGPGGRLFFRSQAVVDVMRTCDIPEAHRWLLGVREEESGVTGSQTRGNS